MNKVFIAALALSCFLIAPGAFAQATAQPRSPGIESNDYIWNEVKDEALLALRASADPGRGAVTYKLCHGCHRAGGLGSEDGLYPRLAGQHDTVLIKQLVDIRNGVRDNPKMYPFADQHAISTQDIADLAAYLSQQPAPLNNGRGPGTQVAAGAALYARDCASCHGKSGQGRPEKFYPRLAGQHYLYLKHELNEIATTGRRNANPKMVRVIKRYSESEMVAVADYLSRLPGKEKH